MDFRSDLVIFRSVRFTFRSKQFKRSQSSISVSQFRFQLIRSKGKYFSRRREIFEFRSDIPRALPTGNGREFKGGGATRYLSSNKISEPEEALSLFDSRRKAETEAFLSPWNETLSSLLLVYSVVSRAMNEEGEGTRFQRAKCIFAFVKWRRDIFSFLIFRNEICFSFFLLITEEFIENTIIL